MRPSGAESRIAEDRSFRRTARLLRRSDFNRVFRNGKRRARNAAFTLISLASPTGQPRLGVAIGKRHAKRAVDRNRIKRVVRESFRAVRPQLAGHDVVVVPGRNVTRLSNRELFDLLARAWRQLDRARVDPIQATSRPHVSAAVPAAAGDLPT